MTDTARNIISLKQLIPPTVKLVAVSKTRTAGEIMEAYNTGHRSFGENRVQELLSKKDELPADIEWHMVGHLQTNKVKYIVPFISMIHSVDTFRLLTIIDEEARRAGRIVKCLLQLHIAEEETKSGLSMDEAEEMVKSEGFRKIEFAEICGVMGMATFTGDMEKVRKEFRILSQFFKSLKEKYFVEKEHFMEISMGMSGDFLTAIEEGSTIIRIGTAIFGERK